LLENEFSFPTVGTRCGIIDESCLTLPWRIDRFFGFAVGNACSRKKFIILEMEKMQKIE